MIGPIIVNEGRVVRPSQLIASVRQTTQGRGGELFGREPNHAAPARAAAYGLTGYASDELRTNGRRATDRRLRITGQRWAGGGVSLARAEWRSNEPRTDGPAAEQSDGAADASSRPPGNGA